MTYIIEGTITEVTISAGKYKLKICGTEEYSLSTKANKETINVNVLCHCEQNSCVVDNKEPAYAIRVPDSFDFNVSGDYVLLCTAALSAGEILRFVFEEVSEAELKSGLNPDGITYIVDKNLKIVSLSLLAN